MNIYQKAIQIALLFFLISIGLTPGHSKAEELGIIVITDMGFAPQTLTFNEGEAIQLIIHNQDDQVHAMVIPKLNLSSPYLMKGEMATLRFAPQQSGSFQYHANSSKFGEPGFTGTLIIKKKTDK